MYCFASPSCAVANALLEQAGFASGARVAERARFVVGLSPAVGLAAWHRWVLWAARGRQIAGIALGSVVYLRDASLLNDWPLLMHETTHLAQVHRSGTLAFLARYAAEYLAGRLRGQSDWDAYRALSAEVQARAVEAVSRTQWPAEQPWVVPCVG